ncbi:hypothetical protein AKJ44_02695 [candidate division MSBL1 archaeon SCGC-AAA261F17]|uniref:DUF2877 domain-containing protein n=1 Tax=candidate division MSBL1 archaeon SCGC-AAA261F17 TaxID=1698274 RepID=A0A133V4E1_9EURY|nr:hypothetical protein AKJ44_02695 [candidate division MSBL1 archaeon SCGC-AAA261F17]
MERLVKATLIGSSAHEALECESGEVHSIFERTFNILLGDKLVGIARSGVTPSPINIITDIPSDENMSALGIDEQMTVRREDNRLSVNDVLKISLESAEIWRPKTGAEGYIDFELTGRNLELAKRLAADKSRSGGLGQLLPSIGDVALGKTPQISDLNQVARKALPQIVGLVKSSRARDVTRVREYGQNLIGLGQGLSPSADDMLSGSMVARWWVANSLSGNLSRVKAENEAIIDSAEKTTLMSQQLLRHAAKGEVNEAVESLLGAILTGTAADVGAGVERVFAIGETSGIDMMVGLLLGLEVGLEKIE